MVFLSNGYYIIVDGVSVSVYVVSWQAWMHGAMRPCHHPPTRCFFSRHLVQTVRDPSELPWHWNMPLFNSKPRLRCLSVRCHYKVCEILIVKWKSRWLADIAFGSATVTFCMYSISTFCFVIFTLTQLCCNCVSDVSQYTYRESPVCIPGYIQGNSLLWVYIQYTCIAVPLMCTVSGIQRNLDARWVQIYLYPSEAILQRLKCACICVTSHTVHVYSFDVWYIVCRSLTLHMIDITQYCCEKVQYLVENITTALS